MTNNDLYARTCPAPSARNGGSPRTRDLITPDTTPSRYIAITCVTRLVVTLVFVKSSTIFEANIDDKNF